MEYTPADQPTQSADATATTSVLTRQRKLIIVGAILAVAFAYFAYNAFVSATSFYLSVDELVAQGPADGEFVQVKGSLVPLSFERAGDRSTLAYFQLEDGGATVNATYDGVLPDLFFNPHSEIVVGGTYNSDGTFVVDRDKVLVKCPSKYQSLDVENPYDQVPPAAQS